VKTKSFQWKRRKEKKSSVK